MIKPFYITTALIAFVATTTATNCTREAMSYPVNYYVWSQTQGQIGVLPVLASVPYTENRKPASFIDGVIQQFLIMDWNATFYDTTTCTAFAEMVATEEGKSYVLGMRLEMKEWHEVGEPAPEGQGPLVVTKMDSVVTTVGDWFFNASATLGYYRAEKPWTVIPLEKRDSREVLQAAADAYADRFSNASVVVPLGTPCCRIEGGASTCARKNETMLNTCTKGFPDAENPQFLKDREYVIDEELGVVQVSMNLGGLADSHLFRIEDGMIRGVHTMTACGESECTIGNGTVF